MKSKKHIERSPQATSTTANFFVPSLKENVEPNPQVMSKEETQVCAQSCTQVSIDWITREQVIRTEIRRPLKTVECKFSMRSCGGINELSCFLIVK